MKKAMNSNIMKEKNKLLILDAIRKNKFSRTDIAKATNLTKAAVSYIVDDLINEDVVFETKSCEGGVGRHPMILGINPAFMHAIGLNITRNKVEMGIVNISGKVLCQKTFPSHQKKEAVSEIIKSIDELTETSNIGLDKIYGIGISSPGPVDVANTTILNPVNFDEWHYENIGLRLKTAFDKNVYLENISSVLALSEKYFGICKDMQNFLVLNVDEGIGSGIMISGKLLRNTYELGHTSICYNGIQCECGNYGCVEKYASIPSILNGTKFSCWKDVVNSENIEIINREAQFLSCIIINAVNLFSLESVILEGEINYKTDIIFNIIKQNIKRNKITNTPPKLYAGSSFGGVLCAATTVFDNYFNSVNLSD